MKKKIVIGSLLAFFILMMLPSVSAVEFNTAVESNKPQLLEQIKEMDIAKIKEKIRDINIKELKDEIQKTPVYDIFDLILELFVWFLSYIIEISLAIIGAPFVLCYLFVWDILYPMLVELGLIEHDWA